MKSKGRHITLDYCDFKGDGDWMLSVLRAAVSRSAAREVHAHVEQFDGIQSPLGFAAVVLIDESATRKKKSLLSIASPVAVLIPQELQMISISNCWVRFQRLNWFNEMRLIDS